METTKQQLAQNRNYFKFVLSGLIKPITKDCLTEEELVNWNQIIELQKNLLEDFDRHSIEKGLKVPVKCWCGKPAKYPNPDLDFVDKYPLVCKKHSVAE